MKKVDILIISGICLVGVTIAGGLVYEGIKVATSFNSLINGLTGGNSSADTVTTSNSYNSSTSGLSLDEFRTVVELHPEDREARYVLAYDLAKSGQEKEAKALFQELAKKNDDWGREAKRHLD